MSGVTMKVTSDFTENFNKCIAQFKHDAVLVGIPSDGTERDDDDPITNAAILAINHFGSEEAHIPPRPVLTIGIRKAQDPIAEEFKKAAQNVLKTGPDALRVYYERAGIIASNEVKKVINSQDGILPPSDATLEARKYLTQSGFKGTKSLLVTGQLRNAITYVVKNIWGK